MTWDGLLIVNKPPDRTSNTVVQKIKRRLHTEKAGHLGTLDPLASGVFPVCLGKATRLASFYMGADKCYITAIRFGFFTTTDDREGEPTAPYKKPDFSKENLEKAISRFQGEYKQTPPAFSAKKMQGKKAYEMARKGQPLQLAPQMVQIREIKLIHFDQDVATLYIHCSTGTYVRSIARDLGTELECGAHVQELTRTKFSDFSLTDCCDPDGSFEGIKQCFIPMEKMLNDLPQIVLDESQQAKVLNGSSIRTFTAYPQDSWIRLFGRSGHLIALAQAQADKQVQPKIVFH